MVVPKGHSLRRESTLPQLYHSALEPPPQPVRLLPFKNPLFHPFAHIFNKYILHVCYVPALGQVLGVQYSVPDF